MLTEIPLTNEEKLLIERKCLEEVSSAEDIDDSLRLPESMVEEIVGTKALKWTFLGSGLIASKSRGQPMRLPRGRPLGICRNGLQHAANP